MNDSKSQVFSKEYKSNGELKSIHYTNGDVARVLTVLGGGISDRKCICHEHIENGVKSTTCIPILEDRTQFGKVRPWRKKKASNMLLADIYEDLATQYDTYYLKRAERLRSCASFLKYVSQSGKLMMIGISLN